VRRLVRRAGERSGSARRAWAVAVVIAGDVEHHDSPSQRAELAVDLLSSAIAGSAPIRMVIGRRAPAIAIASIEDHFERVVTGEHALEVLVDVRVIPRHHEEVAPDLGRPRAGVLVEEASQWGDRSAATGRAASGTELEAGITVEADGQTAKREMEQGGFLGRVSRLHEDGRMRARCQTGRPLDRDFLRNRSGPYPIPGHSGIARRQTG